MENSYVSHLECSITGKKYEANKIHGLSEAGRPLLVRYNLEKLKNEIFIFSCIIGFSCISNNSFICLFLSKKFNL